MRIGYARVSTEDQNLDLQRDALRRAGCARVFQEKRSGATGRRPALDRALRAARPGDVLVVWKLDRLGRSLQDLIAILEDLKAQGVEFCSLSDAIDTTTPAGKLLFHVTGAVAEFERSLISERTKAGMAVAARKGRKPGRPRRLDSLQTYRVQHMAICDEIPVPFIAREMAVSESTVRRVIRQFRSQAAAAAAAAVQESDALRARRAEMRAARPGGPALRRSEGPVAGQKSAS